MIFQLFETLLDEHHGGEGLLDTLVKDFLLNVGPRGVLTMLGHRKTAGSQDIPWPSYYELR